MSFEAEESGACNRMFFVEYLCESVDVIVMVDGCGAMSRDSLGVVEQCDE